MSRGAGFWPGGRERSVPPDFPGERADVPFPEARPGAGGDHPVRGAGYRPRRFTPDPLLPVIPPDHPADDPTLEDLADDPRPAADERPSLRAGPVEPPASEPFEFAEHFDRVLPTPRPPTPTPDRPALPPAERRGGDDDRPAERPVDRAGDDDRPAGLPAGPAERRGPGGQPANPEPGGRGRRRGGRPEDGAVRLGPRKRVVAEEERRVGPAVAASRRAHPTARALVAGWPGSNAGALPPDFPGGGRDDVRLLLVADPPLSTKSTKKAKEPTELKARRSLPIRPPQSFNNVVAAVYAALADPLAADSAEAREQRAARVREVGLVAASTALVALLVYGIFPVRTFLNQRAATSDAEERLERIAEANDRLTDEVDQLQDDDEIELRARSDYGWVFPGEELYGVLPAPVATTTTTMPPDEDDD